MQLPVVFEEGNSTVITNVDFTTLLVTDYTITGTTTDQGVRAYFRVNYVNESQATVEYVHATFLEALTGPGKDELGRNLTVLPDTLTVTGEYRAIRWCKAGMSISPLV